LEGDDVEEREGEGEERESDIEEVSERGRYTLMPHNLKPSCIDVVNLCLVPTFISMAQGIDMPAVRSSKTMKEEVGIEVGKVEIVVGMEDIVDVDVDVDVVTC